MMKLRAAIDGGRDYDLPERHDPLYLMFGTYQVVYVYLCIYMHVYINLCIRECI